MKAQRPGRDLNSSEPSIRTILDTSVYTVRVCGLRSTNTGHEMKPLKVKRRTNTSVLSEVITTALYPAAAACGPWRNSLYTSTLPLINNSDRADFIAVIFSCYNDCLSSEPLSVPLILPLLCNEFDQERFIFRIGQEFQPLMYLVVCFHVSEFMTV